MFNKNYRFSLVILIATAIGGASTIASADLISAADLNAKTDQLILHTSLPDFMAARATNLLAPALDWTSDSCSYSADQPFNYSFVNACLRHDFGYRNYKKQNRFTDQARLALDGVFAYDLSAICATETKSTPELQSCSVLSTAYVASVRLAGGFR